MTTKATSSKSTTTAATLTKSSTTTATISTTAAATKIPAKQPQSSSGGGGCSVEQADPPDCDLFAEEACGTILFGTTANVTLVCPVLCGSCLHAGNSSTDGSNAAGGSISVPPTELQKTSSSTSTIVGVMVTLVLVVAVVGFILSRQNHHATGGGGIPHLVGQNGGVRGAVPQIYHNRMYNFDTSPSEVYLQPNALQPAWYDSQPGRRSTISATEAGIVYAIPLDLQDDAGSGSTADTNGYAMPLANYAVVGTNSSSSTTTNGIVYAIPVDLQDDAGSGSTADTNSYAMPLANYAVVGTGSSATTNGGGGGGGNHEYAIPEARSKAAPLLPLDLDGYVVDDTVPAGAGAAPGGVVYGSSNENAARLATNSTYA